MSIFNISPQLSWWQVNNEKQCRYLSYPKQTWAFVNTQPSSSLWQIGIEKDETHQCERKVFRKETQNGKSLWCWHFLNLTLKISTARELFSSGSNSKLNLCGVLRYGPKAKVNTYIILSWLQFIHFINSSPIFDIWLALLACNSHISSANAQCLLNSFLLHGVCLCVKHNLTWDGE